MLEHAFWVVLGAFLVAAIYFGHLAITKGIPAAWAWVKSWWTATATEMSHLKADVASAKSDIAALKTKVGL